MMKETLKTEWDKTYTRENNVITVERTKSISFSRHSIYWLATDTDGNALTKLGYYSDDEVDTIEELLKKSGYVATQRIASVPNSTVFKKTF